MEGQNIISVSWGDHLLFGDNYGKLDTSAALQNRMECWKRDLSASTILWRENRIMAKGHFFTDEGQTHPTVKNSVTRDDFEVVPRLGRQFGFKTYVYVSLFDEGWPLPTKKERAVSYHNSMHGQKISWQSEFSRKHPEYMTINRSGEIKQWGVLCLAYQEVRTHFCERYLALLNGHDFDGLFVCLRSQSKPAEFADQFGFNEPIRKEYLNRYGVDILEEDFDLQNWRDLQGEYLTLFLSELRRALNEMGAKLSIGIPRGDVIGAPLGNWTLQWRDWITKDLIDALVIDQNSSVCPSMWIQLWPMHRGYGYLQNHPERISKCDLIEELDQSYDPLIDDHNTNLFIARQWRDRNSKEEMKLVSNPSVTGLVFSSFRFDNPEAINKGNWKA